MHKRVDSWIVFFAALGILAFFLGMRFLSLDDHVYAFGGDAAILYYNMVYYSWYGSGLHLSSMNYPLGESLLMTDAQASVSWILNQLNGISFVKNNIVGWVHGFHYFCFAIAAVFAHRTLSKLGVSKWVSIVGALLVVFMSPQIMRLRAHYGLAYPVLFTGVIYFLVSVSRSLIFEGLILKFNLFLFLLLVFFGFNNIYLLILGAGWCILFSIVYYLIYRNPRILWTLVSGMMAIITVYIFLKWTDPGMDRLSIQWGYYANRIKISGLLYPYTSLIGTLLDKPKTNIESVANLGIVSTILIFFASIGVFFNRSRKLILYLLRTKPSLLCLLVSAFIILVYALGSLKFLAEALPAATMFKASGRFAWPFYYAVSMLSILSLDRVRNYLHEHKIGWRYFFILPFILWSIECFVYLDKHVKFNQYENHYSQERLDKIKQDLLTASIDTEDYQALYTLPAMIGWNDKYHVDFPWSTEFNATRLSLATGLPMINAMLSRMGLDRADEIAQLSGHPTLDRSWVNKLDDRPLLVLLGKDSKLTLGEEWLLSKSRELKKFKDHTLYHLDMKALKKISVESFKCQDYQEHWIYKGFEETNSVIKRTGKGSKVIDRDLVIWSGTELLQDSVFKEKFLEVELSLAVYTDSYKYGMPWIKCIQMDSTASQIKVDKMDMASSKNIQDSWRIGSMKILIDKNVDRIIISVNNVNQRLYVDDLLIRPVSPFLCSELPQKDAFLPNEYPTNPIEDK